MKAKVRGRRIAFRLDSGDAVILGREHPLRIVETTQGPSPGSLVRHGLEAELSRAVYYELAELALAEGSDPPGVWSSGAFFPLGDDLSDGLAERLRAALKRCPMPPAAGGRFQSPSSEGRRRQPC